MTVLLLKLLRAVLDLRLTQHLSGSSAKSGPLDFGTEKGFSLIFVREKGLAHIYQKVN